MTEKNRVKLVMLSFALSIVILWVNFSIQAQSFPLASNDVLIYERNTGERYEFVRLTSLARQAYLLPLDKCSSLSPNGIYVDETSLNRSDLIIRRLDTQQIVIETPWQSSWSTCALFWLTDSTIAISDSSNSQQSLYFDISGGTLNSITHQPSTPQYPSLPNWLLSTQEDFILPSPNSNIFLYERCNSGQTTDSGRQCQGGTDFVIYNTSTPAVVHVLENADGDFIRGYRGWDELQVPMSYGNVAWSSTGRYLAFRQYQKGLYDYFDLAIYDTNPNQYVNTDWVSARIDSFKGFQWSPVGDKLAFWAIDRFGEPEANDNLATLRTLVFFDATTSQFSIVESPFNLDPSDTGNIITWSPNGEGLVFIDQSNNLIHVDVTTNVSSILDNNVDRVVVWRQDTTSILPTLTPTATATP